MAGKRMTFRHLQTFGPGMQTVKSKSANRIRTAAEVCLESPKRQSYGGITFLPGKDAGDHFNLFQGFAVEPAEGRLQFVS